MFSVADFLDRAKVGGAIESDYRLAKVIGISHGTMSGYRAGKSMPDERVIDQLCALSGEDPDLIAAQIQIERARTPEGKTLWSRIAQRLASDRRRSVRPVTTAILSVLFSIFLIAASPCDSMAGELRYQFNESLDIVHIVSTTLFVSLYKWRFLAKGLPGLFRLVVLAWVKQ